MGGYFVEHDPTLEGGVLKRHGEHEPHTLDLMVNGRCTTYEGTPERARRAGQGQPRNVFALACARPVDNGIFMEDGQAGFGLGRQGS